MTDRELAGRIPTLEALAEARLRADALEPSEWGNGPGERYLSHRHDYDKVLVCVEGGIEFRLRELSRVARLEPGDRLELPSNTLHEAVVGDRGVRCLEAHLPPGTLPHRVLHRPGWALGAD
ncbi:MAG: cupin [Chloroflexi bacterium]|nr:cupin [Chloroflexota bacterium]